jgi:hypothetical protein
LDEDSFFGCNEGPRPKEERGRWPNLHPVVARRFVMRACRGMVMVGSLISHRRGMNWEARWDQADIPAST